MFSHPVSGITHTLTVQEIEQQTVPQNSFGSDRWIYPTHYIAMSYTLTLNRWRTFRFLTVMKAIDR